MSGGIFVTGTDTGCGKTRVATLLMAAIAARGRSVVGFKPVAAGATRGPAGLRNDDAEALLASSSIELAYGEINPYCFEPAIAPHIAAQEAGEVIDLDSIVDSYRSLRDRGDCVVVEGAGGWRVPLGDESDIGQLALALGLPVVLVVGVRLGCLNHALLTEQAIRASGAAPIGWIGNLIDRDMRRQPENRAALERRMHGPCLGWVPFLEQGAHPDPRLLDPIADALCERARGKPK